MRTPACGPQAIGARSFPIRGLDDTVRSASKLRQAPFRNSYCLKNDRLLHKWRGPWRLLTAHGRVEIVLATVHWLIVGGLFEVDALARLLSALA
jgi:hypothetical protein